MYQRDRLGQDEMTELTPINASMPADYPIVEESISPYSDYTFTELPADYSYLQPAGSVVETVYPLQPEVQNELAPWQEYGTYVSPAPVTTQPAESTWSWSSLWEGIAPVIKTGAEAFSKIYPVVTAPKTTTQAAVPSGYYRTSTGSVAPIPKGYTVNPQTGQLQPLPGTVPMVTGITASPYFWPVTIGIGALFLLSQSKRRR